jgi:metal-responsive CopG/Arc/MetJ family transcriptional regulator
MKTAISVPDETFRRVDERAAALGMSRSEFFARAAERYLSALDAESRVEAIDAALARSDARAREDAASIGRLGREDLERLTRNDDW